MQLNLYTRPEILLVYECYSIIIVILMVSLYISKCLFYKQGERWYSNNAKKSYVENSNNAFGTFIFLEEVMNWFRI